MDDSASVLSVLSRLRLVGHWTPAPAPAPAPSPSPSLANTADEAEAWPMSWATANMCSKLPLLRRLRRCKGVGKGVLRGESHVSQGCTMASLADGRLAGSTWSRLLMKASADALVRAQTSPGKDRSKFPP